MGIYLNPGKRSFEEAVNSTIYVDKTEMICYLNSVVRTRQKYVCVTRPRGFGKTMTADMICAYYDRTADSRSLFEQTRLCRDSSDQWDRYLGKFDVIHISMLDFLENTNRVSAMIGKLAEKVIPELKSVYPDIDYDPDDFIYSLECFYRSTGIPFVIVIDEWDALFRIRKEDKEGQLKYLAFLRDWLKDKEYIALAYMTGILPIKKSGNQSALNMFDEYTMAAPMQLAPYTGFTDEEVHNLCRKYGRSYEDIRDWYGGYIVNDAVPPDPDHQQLRKAGVEPKGKQYDLYSPLSVVSALRYGVIRNYRNSTESYEALAEYIRRDFDGLKNTVALLMDGGRVQVDLSTYQNDMTTFHSKDDILALLIHLGYLGYDASSGEVFIPNKEILDVFRACMKASE